MSKGLFVTATGTDVGKTYVAGLLAKRMHDAGESIGYYKAALSGAHSIAESDAGFVKKTANLEEADSMLLSYLYTHAVSPHLASRWEGNPVELEVVKQDFRKVADTFEYVLMEGSGGIVCPIRDDKDEFLLLEDIIKALHLPTIIVADAGLGTINYVVTTTEYLRNHGMDVQGVILNHWENSPMQQDNVVMIEKLAKLPVWAKVKTGDKEIDIDVSVLKGLFREV